MTRSAASSTIGRDQRRQGRRVVAEVGVHLDDRRRAAGQGHPEPVEVGPAESLLDGPMADADARIGRGQRVGQAAGAIRRTVVDHEQGAAGSAARMAAAIGPTFSASL